MLISYAWIKEYVDIDVDVKKLGTMLTNAGVIVDNIHDLSLGLDNCVVGELVDVTRHEDSDRLFICKVDIGQEIIQIVTAAENVVKGGLVAVAKVGATLPNGLTIKETELRGVQSCGMLISLEELNYESKVMQPEEREGIFVFPKDSVSIGDPVSKALGMNDYLLELDLTPNRADCSSIYGMAIEVAALLNKDVNLPKYKLTEGDECDLSIIIEDEDLCPQYFGIALSLDNNSDSPLWMQNRLRNASMRPISLVVDIANYVMLETGQPLHTFDYDKIDDKKIIVRRAVSDEELVTLDGIKRKLSKEDLLITDPEKAIGIAGVMGGLNSEIEDNTKRILLESAIFDRGSIRMTSRGLNIYSEAASRFSKGIGEEQSIVALERFIQLYETLEAGQVISHLERAGGDNPLYKTIHLRPEKVNQVAGQDIKISNMSNYLVRLGFRVKMNDDNIFEVTVPSRRVDISEEVDLVEEVLRLEGFADIKSTQPKLTLHGELPEEISSRRKIRALLRASGASEVINYAFYSPEEIEKFSLSEFYSVKESIPIDNPMSSKLSIMRTTLLPGLISSAKYNLNRQVKGVLLSEFGTVFYPLEEKELPDEHEMIGIIAAGIKNDETWYSKDVVEYDFFDVKGILESIFDMLKLEVKFVKSERNYLHPGRTANIMHKDIQIGYIGELHPDVVSVIGLKNETKIVYAEVNHDLIRKANVALIYKPISQFPTVERDIAIVIDKDVSMEQIVSTIKESEQVLLKDVKLFDLYQGDQVKEGYKSCALKLTFSLNNRTLKTEEVNRSVDNIMDMLKNKYDAILR